MSARLDHGALNVPLSKRGNIDAEIDRFKRAQAAEQRAERKRRAADMRESRAEAKALVASLTPQRLKEFSARFGVSVPYIKSKLKSAAHWQPRQVILELSKRCADCADWRRTSETGGECWSTERRDGAEGPADITWAVSTCEVFIPRARGEQP